MRFCLPRVVFLFYFCFVPAIVGLRSFPLLQLHEARGWREVGAAVVLLGSCSPVPVAAAVFSGMGEVAAAMSVSEGVQQSPGFVSGSFSLAADDSALPGQDSVLTEEDNNLVRMGFRDMDAMRFEAAEKEFSLALKRWTDLQRPRDEIVSLLKARANVLVDSKFFEKAIEDYNQAIELMAVDGEKSDGTAQYPEFPDAFVGRALAKEGLAQWADAVNDYSKAITLWGGGRGDGVNPYVLTYRGNSLSKLGRFDEAIEDYRASSDLFLKQRDIARWSDAKANLALTLYAEGRTDESVKAMRDVLRRDAGYADMHVALATTLWDKGSYIQAIAEWDLVCNDIDVGCEKYRDLDWVTRVRRWPANLASKLEAFQDRRVPQSLLDSSESLRRST